MKNSNPHNSPCLSLQYARVQFRISNRGRVLGPLKAMGASLAFLNYPARGLLVPSMDRLRYSVASACSWMELFPSFSTSKLINACICCLLLVVVVKSENLFLSCVSGMFGFSFIDRLGPFDSWLSSSTTIRQFVQATRFLLFVLGWTKVMK